MIISTLAFYLFAGMTVASAFMVIAAKNPVHSVLYLILAFFNSAALFVLLGAEFIAMILFVVMMLDINFTELRQGFLQYLPIGALVGIILLIELILVLSGWVLSPESLSIAAQVAPVTSDLTNTEQLGNIIYTDYAYLFQAAGMVLLVAMIGAIVLTHRQRPGVRKQNIAKQVYRRPEESVAIRKVEPGQGV